MRGVGKTHSSSETAQVDWRCTNIDVSRLNQRCCWWSVASETDRRHAGRQFGVATRRRRRGIKWRSCCQALGLVENDIAWDATCFGMFFGRLPMSRSTSRLRPWPWTTLWRYGRCLWLSCASRWLDLLHIEPRLGALQIRAFEATVVCAAAIIPLV